MSTAFGAAIWRWNPRSTEPVRPSDGAKQIAIDLKNSGFSNHVDIQNESVITKVHIDCTAEPFEWARGYLNKCTPDQGNAGCEAPPCLQDLHDCDEFVVQPFLIVHFDQLRGTIAAVGHERLFSSARQEEIAGKERNDHFCFATSVVSDFRNQREKATDVSGCQIDRELLLLPTAGANDEPLASVLRRCRTPWLRRPVHHLDMVVFCLDGHEGFSWRVRTNECDTRHPWGIAVR